MRFWDSSAIISLLVREATSGTLKALLEEDLAVAAWWSTPIECTSAIGRRERSGEMDADEIVLALSRLAELAESWTEVAPSKPVRDTAVRLVRAHELRAADALQLAAAIVASESQPETLELVTLDDRLATAAAREGFRVLPG